MNTSPKQTIGIVGLGLVGCALASRLKAAGYDCLGFDIRPEAMTRFSLDGFERVASVSAMVAKASTVILAVFETKDVIQVVEGRDPTNSPVLQALGGRSVTFIDCSTGDPDALVPLAERLSARGVGFIEAPLSGSSEQIAAGEATMLLGGRPEAIAAQHAVLYAIARKRIHVGGAGMGARAKLATNLVLGLNRAVLAEGMVFAESLGLTPQTFLELVLNTPARSDAALAKGQKMVNEEFSAQSRIAQHLKDVRLMLGLAAQQAQTLPLSEAHAALMQSAIAAGDGELDNAGIIRQIRRLKKGPGQGVY